MEGQTDNSQESNMYRLTVFTPTYNRAHTLNRLYDSLLKQDNASDFEWLIIDDCSSDNTTQLVSRWIEDNRIKINYLRLVKNGGKPRAINIAVERAQSPFLFIVDSDDYLVPNILSVIISSCEEVANCADINGVGFLRKYPDGRSFAQPTFDCYVDATNIQRAAFGLDVDCNEAYKVKILQKYPFKVWDGEIFTPEATVLNAMALDGYKIRWFNKAAIISEYQEDGMTKGSFELQRKNPMGYAMLFNSNLRHQRGFKCRLYTAVQLTTQCLLGGNVKYLLESNSRFLTLLSMPIALILYFRRLWQYRLV